MLLYKLSQLTRWMVPAFGFVPRERKYTSPVMLQTNRQIFFILAVSLQACCFYHIWQRCAILGRGLVEQIDNGLQEWVWWDDEPEIEVWVCVHLILSKASCGIAETCSDVFSFPMGSFHILPFLATNQTGCSSHSQSAWQMGSRVKNTAFFFILFQQVWRWYMQHSSVSLTPDFLFDFSSVSKF